MATKVVNANSSEELATEKQIGYLRDLLWQSSMYYYYDSYTPEYKTEWERMMRNLREWQHAIAFTAFARVGLNTGMTKKQASALIDLLLRADKHPGRFMAKLYGRPSLRNALGEIASSYWSQINSVIHALYDLHQEGEEVAGLIADEDRDFVTEMLEGYLAYLSSSSSK